MRDRRALKKPELLAALAELVDVDPEEHAGEETRCHFCLRREGLLHLETCPWLEAAIMLRGDGAIANRRVGEDEDEFEDRLEDDEELAEPIDRAAMAAAARDELASLLGGRPPSVADVPPDLVEEVLGDPLDAPTDWKPEE